MSYENIGGGVLNTDPLKVLAGFGSNLQVDGGMETWTDATNLTNYDFISFELGVGIGAGASLDREASLIHGGTYAAKLTSTATKFGIIMPKVAISGLTAGDTYRLRVWIRSLNGTGGSAGSLGLILNDIHTIATQIWNHTLQQWDSFTGFGSIGPGNGFFTAAVTTSFVQTTYNVTVPANGKLVIGLGSSPNDTDPIYYDDADLMRVVTENNVTLLDVVNASTGSELTASDYVFKHRTTGGTDKNHLALSGTGVYTTDYSTFNLSAKPVESATPTGATHTINKAYFEKMASTYLGSSSGIDLKALGQRELYTVPLNKKLIDGKVILEVDSINAVIIVPAVRVGTSSGGYTEVVPLTNVSGSLSAVGHYVTHGVSNSDLKKVVAAGGVIKLDVETAATATTFTVTAHLFGILIDV